MQDKITWYEEILAQDPASPLFYNLALLYLEQGERDKAIEYLKSGLDKNPTHAQGRLLLVQALSQADFPDQAKDYMAPLLSGLCSCPQFWLLWADLLQKEGKGDLAAAVGFIGADLRHDSLSWAQVLCAGVHNFLGQNSPATREEYSVSQAGNKDEGSFGARKDSNASQQDAVHDEQAGGHSPTEPHAADQETFRDEDLTPGGYRTVTMADILAGQGEYEAALEIYAELLDQTDDLKRRQQIEARMSSVQSKMNHQASREAQDFGPDNFGHSGNECKSPTDVADGVDQEETQGQAQMGKRKNQELLRRLDRLAARLEART